MAMKESQMQHHQEGLGISLIMESTTQVNLGKSVLCLTAGQNSKEIASTKSQVQT